MLLLDARVVDCCCMFDVVVCGWLFVVGVVRSGVLMFAVCWLVGGCLAFVVCCCSLLFAVVRCCLLLFVVCCRWLLVGCCWLFGVC